MNPIFINWQKPIDEALSTRRPGSSVNSAFCPWLHTVPGPRQGTAWQRGP